PVAAADALRGGPRAWPLRPRPRAHQHLRLLGPRPIRPLRCSPNGRRSLEPVRRAVRVRPDLGPRLAAALHVVALAVFASDDSRHLGPVALSGARSRSLRPRAPPRQPSRRKRVRRPPEAEPRQPSPRVALQSVPLQSPPDRRARRLHQQLSTVGAWRARTV